MDDSSDDDELIIEEPKVVGSASKLRLSYTGTGGKETVLLLESSDEDDDEGMMIQTKPVAKKPPPAKKPSTQRPPAPPRPMLNNSLLLESSSDEDSLPPSVSQQQQQKALEKDYQRRKRQLEKENAKQEKQLQRVRKKVAKEAAKMAETKVKHAQKQQAAQRSGKYAEQEMVVLIDDDHDSSIITTMMEDSELFPYFYKAYRSGLSCRAVQWIRRPYIQGGAEQAYQQLMMMTQTTIIDSDTQHVPILVIVVEANEFLDLLNRTEHEEEDDYPLLEQWITGIQAGWKAAWRKTTNPRVILLLNQVKQGLEKQWVNYRRNRTSDAAPPSEEELHDAITWILVEFGVECVHCDGMPDVIREIRKITYVMAFEPYQTQTTELQCIRKLKAQVSDTDPPFERVKDAFERQIQQVPGVGLPKARNLVQHFPTAQSLWRAYQNKSLSEDEKRALLADCFAPDRSYYKLSDSIYRLFTSNDPKQLI